MEFWAYYRILKRRRWLLVAALLAAIVVAIAANRPQVGDFDSSANLSVPSMQRFFFVYGTQGSQNLAVDRTPQALDLVRGRDLADPFLHHDATVRDARAGVPGQLQFRAAAQRYLRGGGSGFNDRSIENRCVAPDLRFVQGKMTAGRHDADTGRSGDCEG